MKRQCKQILLGITAEVNAYLESKFGDCRPTCVVHHVPAMAEEGQRCRNVGGALGQRRVKGQDAVLQT